jgi:hypothetical protein
VRLGNAVAALALAIAIGCAPTRDPGTIPCTPGEAITVACGCGVGSCSGDPVLRVCDGARDVRACADALEVIAESDDACGTRCPSAALVCPPGGSITVIHRAFREGGYECAWEMRTGAADGG